MNNIEIIDKNKIDRELFWSRFLYQIELDKKSYYENNIGEIPIEFFDYFVNEMMEFLDFKDILNVYEIENYEVIRWNRSYRRELINFFKENPDGEFDYQWELTEPFVANTFKEMIDEAIWIYEDDQIRIYDYDYEEPDFKKSILVEDTSDLETEEYNFSCAKYKKEYLKINNSPYILLEFARFLISHKKASSYDFYENFEKKIYILLQYRIDVLKRLSKNKYLKNKPLPIWILPLKSTKISQINFRHGNLGVIALQQNFKIGLICEPEDYTALASGIKISENLFLTTWNYGLIINKPILNVKIYNNRSYPIDARLLYAGKIDANRKIKNLNYDFAIFKTFTKMKYTQLVESEESDNWNKKIIVYYDSYICENKYKSTDKVKIMNLEKYVSVVDNTKNYSYGNLGCIAFSENNKLISIIDLINENCIVEHKINDIIHHLKNYCGIIYNHIINKDKLPDKNELPSIFSTLIL